VSTGKNLKKKLAKSRKTSLSGSGLTIVWRQAVRRRKLLPETNGGNNYSQKKAVGGRARRGKLAKNGKKREGKETAVAYPLTLGFTDQRLALTPVRGGIRCFRHVLGIADASCTGSSPTRAGEGGPPKKTHQDSEGRKNWGFEKRGGLETRVGVRGEE